MITNNGLNNVSINIQNNVERVLKETVRNKNQESIPNCNTIGYVRNVLLDPEASRPEKEIIIGLYNILLDPEIPQDIKQSLTTQGPEAIAKLNLTRQAEIKTIVFADDVTLPDMDKTLIDKVIKETTRYIMDNIAQHIEVVVVPDISNPDLYHTEVYVKAIV